MRTSVLFFATLIIALISITEATVSSSSSTSSNDARPSRKFRHRARHLRKRQFADNSQLINLEQNGNILELFSTTTNVASPRGRTNSPNMNNKPPVSNLLGGLFGGNQP